MNVKTELIAAIREEEKNIREENFTCDEYQQLKCNLIAVMENFLCHFEKTEMDEENLLEMVNLLKDDLNNQIERTQSELSEKYTEPNPDDSSLSEEEIFEANKRYLENILESTKLSCRQGLIMSLGHEVIARLARKKGKDLRKAIKKLEKANLLPERLPEETISEINRNNIAFLKAMKEHGAKVVEISDDGEEIEFVLSPEEVDECQKLEENYDFCLQAHKENIELYKEWMETLS